MRSAGILLPVTALPAPWGIGTMGQAARDFICFLQKGGQSFWQVLPVCPTGFGDSPYQSFSSWAGNPYLIDLDDLAREGLLHPREYRNFDWGSDPERVDYGLLYRRRFPVLRLACRRLEALFSVSFRKFCRAEASWLDDYALFMALKDRFGSKAWTEWNTPLRRRESPALDQARGELAGEIRFWQGVQFLFFRQWRRLKEYANLRGISIIGDLPIYVSSDSADVWSHPEQFQLDGQLLPMEVAGCPPDGFSPNGQLWGNPLFDWERMKADGYSWWIRRIAFQFRLFDVLRIDHFRGFDAYYAIPFGAADACNGRWRPGPGLELFQAVERALGRLPIIAEDLGFLTPSVRQLLEDTGFPGMKVLQFAFDSRDTGSGYLPHCYPRRCVAYTGTHDNDTLLGWAAHAPAQDVDYAVRYLRLTHQEGYHWGMIRSVWASVADLAVIPLQDLLGLDSRARFNIPSTLGGNWVWRCLPGACSVQLAQRLRREMELYQRLPAAAGRDMQTQEVEQHASQADP